MKNAEVRLLRLEAAIPKPRTVWDPEKSVAYQAMPEEDKQLYWELYDKFDTYGVQSLSDEELKEFERLLTPLTAEDEQDNGEEKA